MLAFNKRIICLFASLGVLACFPNNSVSLKKTAARIQWKPQNVEKNNYNQEVQVPGFIVKKATRPKVDNLSKSFCFFTAPGFGNGVYVAEIPETQENNFELYEVKLIDNALANYDYAGYNSLKSEPYVVEFLYAGEELTKEFYIPTKAETDEIINKSIEIGKQNEKYHDLITSITTEASFKASLSSPISLLSNDNKADNVNSQPTLDHYLSAESNAQTQYLTLGSVLSEAEPIPTTDNSIVNLIPKKYFRFDGEYQNAGAEWGYFIKTYKDYDNNKISSVLIYDIFNIKKEPGTPDTVQIKPVFSWNFKYDYDTDVVSKDSENNYCLGNPSFKAGIKYVKHPNDRGNFLPKNPDDYGYTIADDNGYCIGSYNAKYIGTHKNYKGSVSILGSAVVSLGNIALGVVTSGFSTVAQLAIGAAYTAITDLARQARIEPPSKTSGTETHDVSSTSGYGSLYEIKQAENPPFRKFIQFPSPTTGSENPLLFKDSSNSINYQIQLLSSDDSNNYTCLFLHGFSCSIFNDNSRIFHSSPDFVSTITANWAYLFGGNFKPKQLMIDGSAQNIEIVYGQNQEASVLLKTKEKGIYDIVLTDMPANTTLAISQLSGDSGSEIYNSVWDTSVPIIELPKQKFLKHYVSLEGNATYEIKVYGKRDGIRKFGGALLSVFKSDSSTVKTGASEYGRNYTYRNRVNNGYLINNCFVPEKSGIYTIVAAPSSGSSSKDTKITLLDPNFRKIAEDDDGFGGLVAGIRINLIANKEYYIISGFYSLGSTGDYEVDIFKQQYFPEMRGKITSKGFTFALGKTISRRSFLVSQSSKRNISFYANWDTTISDPNFANIYLEIYNPRIGTLLYRTNILFTNCTFEFESGALYLIEFSATTDLYTNVHLSCKEVL